MVNLVIGIKSIRGWQYLDYSCIYDFIRIHTVIGRIAEKALISREKADNAQGCGYGSSSNRLKTLIYAGRMFSYEK
jgi:hypothetical protein